MFGNRLCFGSSDVLWITDNQMNNAATLSKVPAVTLGFWIIKIFATTLGETGGDTVTMTMNWGYLAGTALFLSALAALVVNLKSCPNV